MISYKLPTPRQGFFLDAFKDTWMGQSMMCSKVNKIMVQEKEEKRKSQKEEVVKRTNAEAQEQENVFQKEEKIINASVGEVMQEDIVKEVIS